MFGWFEQIKDGKVIGKYTTPAYDQLRIFPLIGWDTVPEENMIRIMGKTSKGKYKFRSQYFYPFNIEEFNKINIGDYYEF
jgi:hypothetical protein